MKPIFIDGEIVGYTSDDSADDRYEEHKERVARTDKAKSLAGRDIGDIPPVEDQARRDSCERDFRLFLLTYFSKIFTRPFCPDVLTTISWMQRIVLDGGLKALAEPRGFGKTTRSICLCLWALLYGHRRFAMLIGKNATSAKKNLEDIKTILSTNPLLKADFPEVCYPIEKLEGISNRARGQLHQGKATHIAWRAQVIVFPTIEGSVASGAILYSVGIDSSEVRGPKHARDDGTIARPDLIIPDDPQDRESAESLEQCDKLERLIGADILGTVEPGKTFAVLMPCTVLRPDDLADRMLDRRRNPDWQGHVTKLLKSMPTNEKLWEQYADLRAEGLRMEQGTGAATEFYAQNREAMDQGGDAADELLFKPDEVSAIQYGMNLYFRDPEAFWSEYQNTPRPQESQQEALDPKQVSQKLSGLERGECGPETTRVVAFIDVHDELLYYAVYACDERFGGSFIEAGTYPEQGRGYFSLRDARPTLSSEMPGAGTEGAIYAGLEKLTDKLLEREWNRRGGGALRIRRCLIDGNYSQMKDTVYQFCRQSRHAALLMPSHGKGITASTIPLSQWTRQPGTALGLEWRVQFDPGRAVRWVMFDSNYWKTFLRARIVAAMGDKSSVSLWGAKPEAHRLLADHLGAEYPVKVEARGRKIDEWKQKPNRDNHWFDCAVGCMVAASIDGAKVNQEQAPQGKTIRQLQEEARKRKTG